VSATILGARHTIALCALSVIAITVLAVWHAPLPWRGGGLDLPLVYVLGLWAALGLGIVFFAMYAFRVAAEARRMSDALAATQITLSRERQLSAVGALAAAAAHELGTPLGTILVASREIAADLPPDSPIRGDVELLVDEAMRCRDILANLAARPEGEDAPFTRMPVTAVVELAARPHLREQVQIRFASGAMADGAPQPEIGRTPPILHGLGNLIQNAVQIARSEVAVDTRWSDREVVVRISDDGPGFPHGMLERLGEPYVSSRRDDEGDHMGLGIFIAQALLGRTGGTVSFTNRKEGGAEVAVRWNRGILEAAEQRDVA
jgi:two-component system sensor histidine kinase RegB